MECASWLADAQVPFSLVFTKTDKRKKGITKPQENIEAFQVTEGFYKLFWHHSDPLRSNAVASAHNSLVVLRDMKALHGPDAFQASS